MFKSPTNIPGGIRTDDPEPLSHDNRGTGMEWFDHELQFYLCNCYKFIFMQTCAARSFSDCM
jgi:hypothetical protein